MSRWTFTNLPAVNCLDLRKGSARRVTCNACGQITALAQAKSGKWYMCQIVNHTTDAGRMSERYVPWAPHFKECRGDEAYYDASEASSPAGWNPPDPREAGVSRDVYGAKESNGLVDGFAYHRDFDPQETVDLADPRLARVTRLRLISDPGFPVWDVSYVHGQLKDGTDVRVDLGVGQLPKRNLTHSIIELCREARVYAKGLGILDAISTAQ